MKTAEYLTLRAFACDVLRDHLRGTGADAARDVGRASELMVAGLDTKEHAAAGLMYYAAFLREFDGACREGEAEPLARKTLGHAQTLAAFLPERQGAELLRVAGEALTVEPAPAAPTAPPEAPAKGKRWTPETLAALAADRDTHGATRAAERAGISTARLRELLPGDRPARRGYSAFNPGGK